MSHCNPDVEHPPRMANFFRNVDVGTTKDTVIAAWPASSTWLR
jgi:hypothetical protein